MDRDEARRRSLFLTIVGAIVVWLAYLASDAVVPLLVALILAYVLAPVVAALQKRGLSRVASVTMLFLVFFGGVGLAAGFGVPPLVEQAKSLLRSTLGEPARTLGALPAPVADFPDQAPPRTMAELEKTLEAISPGLSDPAAWDRTDGRREGNYARVLRGLRESDSRETVETFREKHRHWRVTRADGRVVLFDDRNDDGQFQQGYLFKATLSGASFLRDRFRSPDGAETFEDVGIDALPAATRALAVHSGDLARGALGVLGLVTRLLGWLVIVPLYTFFFLMRLEDVWTAFRSALPGVHRDRVLRVLLQIHLMLMGFFRGRLLTMLLKGIMVAIGLLVVGAPYWPVFGALAGLLTIVPVAGPLLAAGPSVALAYADHGGTVAMLAGIVFLAAEAIEGYVLIPQLVGREVGLHPLAVVAAILVGAALLGMLGVVLAIPLAAAAKIVWAEFVLPTLRAKASEAKPAGEPGSGAG